MPEEGGSKQRAEVLVAFGEDDVDILETLAAGNGSGGMLVQLTEIRAKLTLLVDVEVVLVAEENDTTNGNETSEVVLLSVGELGKLDAVDLGADLGVVVEDIGGGVQKVAEVGITLQALVLIGNRAKGWPLDVGEARLEVIVLVGLVGLDDGPARLVVESGGRLGSDGLEVLGRVNSYLGSSTLLEVWCHAEQKIGVVWLGRKRQRRMLGKTWQWRLVRILEENEKTASIYRARKWLEYYGESLLRV